MILRFSLFAAALFTGLALSVKTSPEDELRAILTKSYNPLALPDSKTTVKLRITVIHFSMNTELQSMDMDTWVSMEWEDPRLNWKEESYPSINRLSFDRKSLWHPDLSLYNNANGDEINSFGDSRLLVMPGGNVMWVPPWHMKAACVMDMTYWPHDIHNCTANLGSWVHSTNTLDFRLKDEVINFETIELRTPKKNITRSEWEVLDTSVRREGKIYSCCPEEYVAIKASMLIRRASPAYSWMVQAPVVVLCLMTVAVYILPPSAGEKVILASVTLALDVFFLFAVSRTIGHAPTHTPLIVELVSKQVILTGATVIISCIILRIVRDPHTMGLPAFIKMPIVILSSCLCLGGYRQLVATTMIPITRSMKTEDLELNESGGTRGLFTPDSKGGGESDWLLLAAVIDRICLIIFTAIFLSSLSSYWSVL